MHFVRNHTGLVSIQESDRMLELFSIRLPPLHTVGEVSVVSNLAVIWRGRALIVKKE